MNDLISPAGAAENKETGGFNDLDVPTIPHYQATASTEGEDIDPNTIYARIFSPNSDADGRFTNNTIANNVDPPISLPLALPTQSQYLELEPAIPINAVLPQSESSFSDVLNTEFNNRESTSEAQSPAVSVPNANPLCPKKMKGINNVADESMSLFNGSTWFPDLSNLVETDMDMKNIEQIIRTSVIAGIAAITSTQSFKKRDEKNVETEARTNTKTETDTPIVNLTVHIGNIYYKDDVAPCTKNSTNTKQQQQQSIKAGSQHFTSESSFSSISTPEPTFLQTSAFNHLDDLENLEKTTEHCEDEAQVMKKCPNSDEVVVEAHTEKTSIINYSPSDNIERGIPDLCNPIPKTLQHFDSDSVPLHVIMSQFVHDKDGSYKCIQTGCSTKIRHRQSVRRHWIKHYKKSQQQQKRLNRISKCAKPYVSSASSSSTCSSSSTSSTANKAAITTTTATSATASYLSSVGSSSASSSSSSARSSNGSDSKRNKVKYVCLICDSTLSRRDTYRRHMRSHKQMSNNPHQENISDVEEDMNDSNSDSSDLDDEYVEKEDFGFGKRFGPPISSRKRLILYEK